MKREGTLSFAPARVAKISLAIVLAIAALSAARIAWAAEQRSGEATDLSAVVDGMTLDEKISQMIVPAIRTWNGQNVTDLAAVPELAQALRAHQYGGIILFGANVVNTEQTAQLVTALQANNAKAQATTHIPYLMPVDEEGGIVLRLSSGTRMTGNMAIGATGENAEDSALATGLVIGEELAALGFNANFAPVIDVNSNAANPVIGTRAFSDDAQLVSKLGLAYANGLAKSNVIATYKHFPGHGDTSVDSHIGTPSVGKTYDELKQTELVPFETVIALGADLIMTAHITYPGIDDEQVFGDGVTKGYFPATMSKKMITDILRNDMGFKGVVVTDALEMDAIAVAGLVPGEQGSAEYHANVGEKVINAGVDILLLPMDLKTPEVATQYDEYIAALIAKVEDGTIDEARINESVLRILTLKQKYGILGADTPETLSDDARAKAVQTVGSDAHHATEKQIAREAITLVKNEGTLPLAGEGKKIVVLGREPNDSLTIQYALKGLQERGLFDKNAQITNLVTGATTGSSGAKTNVTIDYYYDISNVALHYTDALKEAIGAADVVVGFSKCFNLAALQPNSPQYQGLSTAIADAHAAGAKFVLLSDNLPYDAARYQDADAILLAYMGSGLDLDPTARNESNNMPAYNANVVAALEYAFGDGAPTGKLPVNLPAITVADDGTASYASETLYERGFGLTFDAAPSGGGSNAGPDAMPFVIIGVVALAAIVAAVIWNRSRKNAEKR